MSSTPAPEWLRGLAARADELPAVFPHQPDPPSEGRRSAVLILFGPHGDEADVLLTQRAADLRSHPGQVAFPGGGVDASDASAVAAALREAHEETGLEPDGVQVLGTMSDLFLPPSAYLVTPVLGWWARPSPVAPADPREVARVVRVPLEELVDPANRFTVRHPSGYAGPGFQAAGLFVWGFTAGLLARVLAEAGLEKPWDTKRFEPLPAQANPIDRSAR